MKGFLLDIVHALASLGDSRVGFLVFYTWIMRVGTRNSAFLEKSNRYVESFQETTFQMRKKTDAFGFQEAMKRATSDNDEPRCILYVQYGL